MKKLFALVLGFMFMVAPAYAGPSFSAGGGGGSTTLTIATDCSSYTTEGTLCWDSDNDTFYVGDGAAALAVGPGSSLGDITDVWNVNTGNVNALVAASGDSFNASAGDSSVPFVHATDCSAVVAEGRTCWDTDDNILYIGDGATQVKIIKSGAIVNADIAAGAAIAYSKLATLTSGNIIVGSATNVATSVTMGGDATIIAAGTLTIGDDKILEKHLKAVDSASDEDILTYESTTGDFEWHTIAEMLAKIGDTRGSVLRRGASGWEAVTPGTVSYPLVSAGAGADPAYSQIVAAGITNNTITATQLAAALTFSDGDLLDLSGITHTGAADEGLAIPTWANVVPTSDKKFLAADGSTLKLYNGGWVSIGATAAPTDATYLTLSNDATLSAERVFTAGTGMDITDAGANSTLTIAFDSTEIGTTTWGSGSAIVWTFDASGGTDATLALGDNVATYSGALTVTGAVTANGGIVMGTGDGLTVNSVNLLSGDELDGTKIKDADYGDVVIDAAGDWQVSDDSHAHTSSTITLASTNLSDTTNIVRLDASNSLTGTTNTVGNADTDILAVQATMRGVGRAVTIDDDTTTAPTYATGTNELFVEGDIEAGGTVYAAAINTGTGTDGSREIIMVTNNDPNIPTATGNKIYFLDNVLKVVEGGSAKDVPLPGDSVTWTGTSHSFAGVTNLIIPTATPDANGEIAINNTNETFLMYINSGLKTLDFSGDSSGYVLKSNGSGVFTLQEDATGSSPTLDTVGDPSGDSTIVMGAGEEVNFDYTGNFTTGSQFKIEQKTGDPEGGVLFEVKVGDDNVTAAKIGDGTNYTQFGKNGAITFAGTAAFSAAGATTSIPMVVGTGTASGITAAGQMYFESDTEILTIGDGATSINLDFTADKTYTFPTTSATLARTDAGQTFTGVNVFTSPTITTAIGATTAGAATLGTALLPFSSVYIGDAATNNIQLTGTAASAKVVTLPGQTGTVTVAPTTTTAGQMLKGTTTAGLGAWSTTVLDDSANTVKLTNGTAVLDIAAAATANIDTNLTVQTGAVTLTGNASGSTLVLPTGSVTLPANPIGGTLGATTNVIPKANGTGTATLQASGITEDGSSVAIGALNLTMSGAISTTTTRVSKVWTAALESTAIPSVNGVAGNATNGLVTNPMTAAGDIIFGGTSGASTSKLAKGTAYQILQMNSGATAPEWTSTLSIANLNMSSATSSIPWKVGSDAAANTAEGTAYWKSDTDALTIGDAATGITLDFTAGQAYTFPTTTATLARTDAANTFTGHQTIEGVTSTGATGTGKFVFDNTPTLVTPVIGAATGTSLIATGIVDGLTNVTLTTDGSEDANTTGKMSHVIINKHTTEATALSVNLPATAIAGMQLLVKNGYGDDGPTTGVITVFVPATHYAWNPTTKTQCAQGYDLVSGGAAGDYIGMIAISSTVWESIGYQGTWTCTVTP